MDALVAEVDLDAQLTAEGVDVAAQGVDLSVFELAAFEGADAVLADVEQGGNVGLCEALGLAEFTEGVSA